MGLFKRKSEEPAEGGPAADRKAPRAPGARGARQAGARWVSARPPA
jgi:hypothetical protein